MGVSGKSLDFSPTAPYKRSVTSHPPLSSLDRNLCEGALLMGGQLGSRDGFVGGKGGDGSEGS